jgi:predicted porin
VNKSLIAIASLALAGSASAQSSVTLWGVVDTGLGHGSGSIASMTRVINSGTSASVFGLRGIEDLGGGMSASFWLEADVRSDDGSGAGTNTNNQASGAATPAAGAQGFTFDRRSTVSLAGAWGELRLGRDYTPSFYAMPFFDPFASLGVGGNQIMRSIITGFTAVRASNSIGYFLPINLGGFYGSAMYYLGENPSNAGATAKDGRGAGVRIGYASGPIDVVAATGRTKYAAGDTRQSNISGSWNFGAATLTGFYEWDSNGAIKARGAVIGGVIPVGVGQIKIAYSRYSTDAVGNPATKKLALGYVHNLSKRTALYATYARLLNDGSATPALNGSITGAGASSTGYDLGIRHRF